MQSPVLHDKANNDQQSHTCLISQQEATAEQQRHFKYYLDVCYNNKNCLPQALQDSLKFVGKSQRANKPGLVQSLTRRTAAISAFLQAQQLFESDAAAAVQICNGLIVEVRLVSKHHVQVACMCVTYLQHQTGKVCVTMHSRL